MGIVVFLGLDPPPAIAQGDGSQVKTFVIPRDEALDSHLPVWICENGHQAFQKGMDILSAMTATSF